MVLIKTLFYTGVRVSELVAIRLDEVDIERCQIRITQGKGKQGPTGSLSSLFPRTACSAHEADA